MKDGFGDHRQKLDYILAELSVEQAKLTLDEFKRANENEDLVDVIKDQLDDEMQKAYLDLSMFECWTGENSNVLLV